MTEGWQFWLTWIVNLAIAIGTLGAVVVALFGEWIRAKMFAPRLALSLVSPTGERIPVTITSPGGESRSEEGRHYRVRVVNERRWPRATQVRVHLIRLEEPGPDNQLQLKWAGEVPLRWTHQEIVPLERTIGPEATCDLCSVVKDKWVALHPIIMPTNLADLALRRSPVDWTVSLQAKSNEGDSCIIRFRISWDGKWDDGETEMARHLVLRQLS
jgi:hypothetical protein